MRPPDAMKMAPEAAATAARAGIVVLRKPTNLHSSKSTRGASALLRAGGRA